MLKCLLTEPEKVHRRNVIINKRVLLNLLVHLLIHYFCTRSVFSSFFLKQKGWPNYWWGILGDPSPIKNSWFWKFSYEPFFEKFVHSANITDSSQFIDHFQNNSDQTSWIFNQSVYKCVLNVSKMFSRKIGSATMGQKS